MLELRLFGHPEIRYKGTLLTNIHLGKALALLAYLAVTGRPHSRSALAGLLWSDMPEDKARGNLTKALGTLRPLFEEYLTITHQAIAFDHESDYWLDVEAFELKVKDGEVARLQEAIQLVAGDFLDGFYVHNAPEFEDWLLAQQARLKTLALQALDTLVAHFVGQDENGREQALEYAAHLLQLEPWREETHRQMMRLLALDGRRSEALAQYESCRRLLAEELGVEPEAETVALYEQIRNRNLIKRAERQENVSSVAQPYHNLPEQTTLFLGRETELAELSRLFAEPSVRLVTIVGPGGMGKTRLALELALTVRHNYQHGVYFISLASLSNPDMTVSAIAAGVGYTFQTDERLPKQQLLHYLRSKTMLLLLDNAEHLLTGVDLFTEILHAAPQVQLLVTSRERLKLMSETVFVLEGLAVSDGTNGEPAAAMQLFLQTAQRIRPTFKPTPANWPALAQVCHLVGGMPLGLILAAAWIEMLSVTEIAAEINRSFDFLAADLRDLPERQRSLRAVFNTTWQRLNEAEQAAFRKLSVFRGGFSREAAQTVTNASLPTLTALSHKSLLRRGPNGRYEIHELLRQYAWEKLGEQLAEVRDKHSTFFCTFLQLRDADLKGARQQAAIAEIETEGENIRVAWQWAVERAQVEHLGPALDSLGLFYLWQSRLREGEALCRLAVVQLVIMGPNEKIGGQTDLYPPAQARFQVRVLIWLSIFQRHLREPEEAEQSLRQAQARLDQPPLLGLDTRAEQAQLWLEQAELTLHLNSEGTRDLVEQSLALYRTLNDPWRMAQGLDFLGEALRPLGQLERARQVKEEGLALRQRLGDLRGMANSLQNLGHTARQAGKFEEAEALFHQCIPMFQQLDDQREKAHAIYYLAGTLVFAGKFEAGLRLFEESLRIYQELNLPGEPGVLTSFSGSALMHLGRYQEARTCFQRSLTFNTDKKAGTQITLGNLGRIALAEQLYLEAQQQLEETLVALRSLKYMQGIGGILGSLGYLALRLGNYRQAHDYIRENLQIAVDSRMFQPRMTALVGVALLRAYQGEIEEAIELYTLALQHGQVANSRWFEDVAGQQIATSAEALPPEVVEAAQTRGRARDLESTMPELLASL